MDEHEASLGSSETVLRRGAGHVLGRHRLQGLIGGDHLRKAKVERGQVGRVHIATREREHRQG